MAQLNEIMNQLIDLAADPDCDPEIFKDYVEALKKARALYDDGDTEASSTACFLAGIQLARLRIDIRVKRDIGRRIDALLAGINPV